ncbi:MAG: creatininase family protein [Gemmatimonadota bacterium]|jgi:creatinine amidohydrolase|nr:MAG: creatininase family protein [Gemmatimonadota bacterium]
MGVQHLAEATWEEIRDMKREIAIALLPIGAIEAHGPHLPMSTDVVIAEAMAGQAAELLAAEGREVLVLPALSYTVARFAERFPGTLSLEPDTLTRLLVDLARSLRSHGFGLLGLANAHLDPAHLTAVRAARDACERTADTARIVFPDITRRPWAGRLTEEFLSGACHAGRFEGSVVMAAAPALVREEIRRQLPPNPASLSNAIRAGKKTFEEAGGPRAYFGWPGDATAEEGDETIQALGGILADAVKASLEGRADG